MNFWIFASAFLITVHFNIHKGNVVCNYIDNVKLIWVRVGQQRPTRRFFVWAGNSFAALRKPTPGFVHRPAGRSSTFLDPRLGEPSPPSWWLYVSVTAWRYRPAILAVKRSRGSSSIPVGRKHTGRQLPVVKRVHHVTTPLTLPRAVRSQSVVPTRVGNPVGFNP